MVAQFTQTLRYFTSDDAGTDETRPFVGSWEFLLVKFLMPGSITATTRWIRPAGSCRPRSPNDVPRRHDVPLEDQSGFFMSSFLSALGPPRRCAGFQPELARRVTVRESVGGTRIDAGATLTRTYVITATRNERSARGHLGLPHIRIPGLAKPVLVSNQQCDGARVLGGLPGGFAWALNLPRGIPYSSAARRR